jgi:hypothetical protein
MRLVGNINNIRERTKGKSTFLEVTIDIKYENGQRQPDSNKIHAGRCLIIQDEE